jgi:hypothetical protein
MMKNLLLTGIAMLTFAISSCDESTTIMGNSLTDDVDQFTIATDTFVVATHSIVADSVLARSSYSYLGRVRDPETGSYITCDYTTQFHILEKELSYLLPPADSISHHDDNGMPIADSCCINVIVDAFQGDSLAAMKMALYELGTPIRENQSYYTNFDPEAEGYVRADGIKQNKVFSISNLQMSDSLRSARKVGGMSYYFTIPLNNEYTDRDGKKYNNYATYMLHKYYEHPEYFRNSINFAHHICPGFYLKTTDGNGVMAIISSTQLVSYFTFKNSNSQYRTAKIFHSTEEVLQTTLINNDKNTIKRLEEDNSCTYLKTPAGIFTEVTLPIDTIKLGRSLSGEHLNDTLVSARIVFQRMLETSSTSEILLTEPTNLLMIERDSLYTFFENGRVPDNTTSFLASYNSTANTYTFNNISTLINHMWGNRGKSENWDKVVLIPVEVNISSSSTTGTSSVVSINNAMDITSVRLVGGSENRHAPVRISVIYNKSN